MKAKLLIAAALIMLAIASAAAAAWWNGGGRYEFGTYGAATAAVRQSLFDADSAKFSNLYSIKTGVVCGMVNARNRFGAYAGARLFEYDTRHGAGEVRIHGMDDSGNLLDGMMWQADCGVSP